MRNLSRHHLCFLEKRSHSVAKVSPELEIPLSQLPKCLDYRCVFSFLPTLPPARFMHPRQALNYYVAQCDRGRY